MFTIEPHYVSLSALFPPWQLVNRDGWLEQNTNTDNGLISRHPQGKSPGKETIQDSWDRLRSDDTEQSWERSSILNTLQVNVKFTTGMKSTLSAYNDLDKRNNYVIMREIKTTNRTEFYCMKQNFKN